MASKTNCTINGKKYYKISRKVGMKKNKTGVWISDRKTFYGSSKKEAEEKYREYMDQKSQKTSPLESMCLGEAIDSWVTNFFNNCELADSSKCLYHGAYVKHFQDSDLCKMTLPEVTAYHLQTFYNENAGEMTMSAIKALHKFLGAFYKHVELTTAGACHDITRPVKIPKTAKPKCEIKKIDTWNDEDLQKVIDALKGTTLRFLVILAANTGLRISEIRALQYSDIDENGILLIDKQLTEINYNGKRGARISDTKSACSNRTIPLPPEIMKELALHKQIHRAEMKRNEYITDTIFTTDRGGYYYRSSLSKRLRKIYNQVGVPAHPFHSFRKTYLTNLRRAGVDLESACRLAGHSSVNITAQYYIGIDDEAKREANSNILKYSFREEVG
ncbi:MAG: site-specific integrase [Clostridia bacterium]|nr:site-specific integrase [Clostridia bacterium]